MALQPDPIGYADGMNMYGYVGGDPVNFIDPSGLDGCTISSCDDTIIVTGPSPNDEDDYWDSPGWNFQSAYDDHFGAGQYDDLYSDYRDENGSIDYEQWCKGHAAECIIVTATRNTPSPQYTPIPDSYRSIYGGFRPGDYCYQNPACSGRANAINFEVEIAAIILGAKSTQLAGRALLPRAGQFLGPSGPGFGDTAFGAARQGALNSGRVRIGFGRHGGRANFRIGIDNYKKDIFSVKIPPSGG